MGKTIKETIDEIQELALKKLEYDLKTKNISDANDPFEIAYAEERMRVGEIYFREDNLYKRLGWSERLNHLDESVIHCLKVLETGQQTKVVKNTIKVPADPISHLCVWLSERIEQKGISNWLFKKAKTKTIETETVYTITKLFLPPWPLREFDRPYLSWVVEERDRPYYGK